jgi:hypothetical protein
MRRALLGVVLASAVGCGTPDEGGHMSAVVTFAATLAPQSIVTVDVFLLAGHTDKGDVVNCMALAGASPMSRTDLVTRYHPRLMPLADIRLANMHPESGLVLVVDGYPTIDGLGARSGYGCTDGVTVTAGTVTPVTVTMGPI